jgi:uncharacterized protein (DUF736 family)
MKFTIFKNQNKKNPKEHDYRILGDGFVKLGACWLKTSKKSGEKFFSCELEEQREQGPEPGGHVEDNIDLPF